jgi:hypothetical protein
MAEWRRGYNTGLMAFRQGLLNYPAARRCLLALGFREDALVVELSEWIHERENYRKEKGLPG